MKKKIAIVTTVGLSLDKLFPDFYCLLQKEGYEIVGICAEDGYVENVRKQGVRVVTVPMTRNFTPVRDLCCLWRLYRIFKRENFDIIHYSTPKASLLSAIAGRIVRKPKLLYTLRGLGYYAFTGIKRNIGKACEKLACQLAHCVIAISKSLKDEAIKEKLVNSHKIQVLGAGSSKGVNLNLFSLSNDIVQEAVKIREHFQISKDDVVIGYAGRLTEEKGLCELIDACKELNSQFPKVHLLLVGDQDSRIPLPEKTWQTIKGTKFIHLLSFTNNVNCCLAAMDIFVLPSYREGFGNVLIEAAALGKPVVGSDIPGCRDALIDGKTGFVVPPANSILLRNAIETLVKNKAKRVEFGECGEKWVKENFNRSIVWERLFNTYRDLLK